MGDIQASERPGRSALLKVLLACGTAAVALLAWYVVSRLDHHQSTETEPERLEPGLPAPDPRLSYRGPYKNIHPDIAYVSDAVCAKCHPKEAKTYSQHPMARTLTPIDRAKSPPLTAAAN